MASLKSGEKQVTVGQCKAKTKARKRPDEAAALLGYVGSDRPLRKGRGKRKQLPTLISELGERKAR